MTFSLIVRDPDTGQFGSAISSSSPAVAARCVNLLDGIGAVNSQNVTDPRLGPSIMKKMAAGQSAEAAVAQVVAEQDEESITYRQLLALDREGNGAAYSGKNALGVNGHVVRKNVVAGGNMLASLNVLDAMVDAVLIATGTLEERLHAALTAAVQQGGEEGPVHSAGLAVVGDAGWRITDLRVDWRDEDPIGELGRILDLWMPQRDAYIGRGHDPAAAPSYGVPGDE